MQNKNLGGIIYGDQILSVPSHMNCGRHYLEYIKKGKSKIALINGATDEKVTYGEMAQQIVNVASSLTRIGVKKGDVVGICCENRAEFLVTAVAVFCSGATVTFINSAYNKNELIHTINISKPKYMFLSPDTYKSFYETLKDLNIVADFTLFGISKNKDMRSFKDLSGKYIDINKYQPYNFNGEVQTALILYSSGTTGLPKGVKLTHRNLIIANLQPLFCSNKLNILTLAPWCNTVGIIITTKSLKENQTIVYLNKFQEDLYLQCIQKYKVNLLLVVPPLIVILAKSQIIKNYDTSSVELMYCGGAPLDLAVMREAKKRFPRLRHILQGYGMTETTGGMTEENENANKEGSVGRIMAANIIKIVDVETRNILGSNQVGELCVKGDILFEGYIGKDIKDDMDDDGFYKTGDIAYYDEDGYFYIVDRIKELIKYKAGQVAPSELEAILLQHSAVNDVAVVGLPDPLVGELPAAFVVKKPGSTITEIELIDFVASKVSSWKQLRGGVRFVNGIPKTASGKILRRVLRDSLIKPPASKL